MHGARGSNATDIAHRRNDRQKLQKMRGPLDLSLILRRTRKGCKGALRNKICEFALPSTRKWFKILVSRQIPDSLQIGCMKRVYQTFRETITLFSLCNGFIFAQKIIAISPLKVG